MKLLTTLFFSGLSLSASTQNKESTVNKSVKDDGRKMEVIIDVKKDTTSLYYKREFDIQGMSKEQKDAIVKHITDSLGVSNEVKPAMLKKSDSD